jgi:single-stranded DNA-binding protein
MGIDIHFTGKIGKTPELKGDGDKQYTTVGIACSRFVGEGRGDPDREGKASNFKTTWLNTVFFKGTAKFVAEKFSQGDTIVVQGELETSTYEKKDRDGHVIDSNALGMRVRANTVEGPFRVVSKNGNGGSATASNGAPTSSDNGQARQAAPLRQAAPPRQAPASTVAAAVDDDPF